MFGDMVWGLSAMIIFGVVFFIFVISLSPSLS